MSKSSMDLSGDQTQSSRQHLIAIRCSRSALLLSALRRRAAGKGRASDHRQEIHGWMHLAVAAKKEAVVERSKMLQMEWLEIAEIVVFFLLLLLFAFILIPDVIAVCVD